MNRTASTATATARRRWWRLHPTTMTAAAPATNNKLSIHVTSTTTTDHADWALPTSCGMRNKELSMLIHEANDTSNRSSSIYWLAIGSMVWSLERYGISLMKVVSNKFGCDPIAALGRDGARVDMWRLLEPSDMLHHPIVFIPDHQQPEALERLLADWAKHPFDTILRG